MPRCADEASPTECGSRDWRLLPPAIGLWAAQLATRWLFAAVMDRTPTGAGGKGLAAIAAVMPWTAGVLLVCLAVIFIARRHVKTAWATCMMVVGLMLIGSLTCWSHLMVQWHDAAAVSARDGPSRITVIATVVEPVQASSIRDADCQVEADAHELSAHASASSSSARLRVFASSDLCGRLRRGAMYRFGGTLREAEFGSTSLWLNLDSARDATMLREPSWLDHARTQVHNRFFDAVSRLSDQGKVLVPGLTLGILGQDHVAQDGSWRTDAIDPAYAARMEETFRRAGIMHLMAVSGGHFVLIAALVRRLCARVLMPRAATAALISSSYTVLAALMAPGDSVLRAQIMGYAGALALGMGRRPQAVSALCCTTIGTLLITPSMAGSFGFALSCAAVLGITVLAEPIGRMLAVLLPDALAKALAVTAAAQLATMPIQVLMQPQLPVWSLLSNVLVAPVVAFSTLTGLAALGCAWCNGDLAFGLAWLSSCGTRVMEVVAAWLGSGTASVLPWKDGATGAVALLLIEALAWYGMMAAHRMALRQCRIRTLPASRRRNRRAHGETDGMPFVADPRNRLSVWCRDTRRFLGWRS